MTYAASGPVGTTEIDLRFRVLNAVDGSCFDVDDVCLQPLAPQCP